MSVNRRQLEKLAYVIDALYLEAMHSPVMKKQAKEDLRTGFLVTAKDDDDDDFYEPEHSFDDEVEEFPEIEYDEEDWEGVPEEPENEGIEEGFHRWVKSKNPDIRMRNAEVIYDVNVLKELLHDEHPIVRQIAARRLKELKRR